MRAYVMTGYGKVSDVVALADAAEPVAGAGQIVCVDEGRIRPVIDQVFPFEALPDAFARLATSRAKGKVVLSVG